jgi:hypothetical protein
MQAVTVTVNGQTVGQYLSKEKSDEIQRFLRDEMRGFRHATQRHISSANNTSNRIPQSGKGATQNA